MGFYTKDGAYFCPSDYHAAFGQKCPTCQQFVEGEIVEFMGKAFHKSCFNCTRCNKTLPSGETVTWTGREAVCSDCLAAAAARRQLEIEAGLGEPLPTLDTSELDGPKSPHKSPPMSPTACAACGHLIQSGQVLQALNAHFHIHCFKCTACSAVLHGEYMARDGRPYCIRDYNTTFGVKCHECEDFIAGRVLQVPSLPSASHWQ